jgi:hypothetical protein
MVSLKCSFWRSDIRKIINFLSVLKIGQKGVQKPTKGPVIEGMANTKIKVPFGDTIPKRNIDFILF